MIVLSHDDTHLVVDVDGLVIESGQRLDRYLLPGRWPNVQSRGLVEIWELPDGRVVRLSKEGWPGADWVADSWV